MSNKIITFPPLYATGYLPMSLDDLALFLPATTKEEQLHELSLAGKVTLHEWKKRSDYISLKKYKFAGAMA